MLESQRHALEMSQLREQINGLADDAPDAERDDLTKRYQSLESKYRAALVLEDTEEKESTPENREFDSLLNGADMGQLFAAVMEHRAVDGRMREVQEHYGLGLNDFPVSMLKKRAVTPAPANVGQNQAMIIPYVFPDAVASFLGVSQPTVGVGEAVYPVLTSELAVGTPAENAPQAETTGAFSADVLTPSRIQASFFYSREDRARFAGMDSALRENLSMGLGDGLDKQILQGVNGLFTGTNLANHAASAVTGFDNYITEFAYGRVDGRYASMASDLRIVMGAATYAHAGNVYRNNSVDRTALDRLMDITGGVRVSAHVPPVVGNKQNALIRRGMNMAMVAPIWEAVTLIPDEVTKADEGQIKVTAVMLHAVKILRADDWYKQESQHA